MATQSLTKVSLPKTGFLSATGGNWQTMTSGSGNGSVAEVSGAKLLALENDTGGTLVYTIKAHQSDPYSDRSLTIPDMDVSVTAGNWALVPISSVFRSSGNITVECDGTGKIACINEWRED